MDAITEVPGTNEALLYTKNDCPNCDSTKELLDQLGVDYTVVDMDANPEAKLVVKGMGFRQAPVVITRSGNWSGHREDKIRGIKGRDLSADDDIWG